MGIALIAELLGTLIIVAMFPRSKPTRPRYAPETTLQWLARSARVWLGIALVGRGRVRGRHSLEWRYPSGRQHQVRIANA